MKKYNIPTTEFVELQPQWFLLTPPSKKGFDPSSGGDPDPSSGGGSVPTF